jgi:hypothetical protein
MPQNYTLGLYSKLVLNGLIFLAYISYFVDQVSGQIFTRTTETEPRK